MLAELFTICWLILMADGSVECHCQADPPTDGTIIEVVRPSRPQEVRNADGS